MEGTLAVLNHEKPLNSPEVEPNDELNIRTGPITRIEIKNVIKKLKNGKAAGCAPATLKNSRETRSIESKNNGLNYYLV